MFKAFGLDNRRQAERWSGELEPEEMSVEALSDSSAMSIADESQDMSKDDAENQPSEMKKATLGGGVGGPARSRPGIRSNSGSVAPMSPAAKAEASPVAKVDERDARMPSPRQWEPEPAPPPRMVPMRRIWERKGSILLGTSLLARATPQKVAAAEAELALNPDRRSVTKQLFDLYAASGDFTRAGQLANRWNERDPFDIEAIVARADMAARRGQRGLAVRILGSVVDVRPNDIGAQQRLYRLQRWQGNAKTACRFASALAAYRTKDAKATAEALRCTTELAAREPQFADLHQELLRGIDASIRSAAERLATMSVQPDTLSGDLRLTAKWNGHSSVDLDLALIDPDGYRISWLGAPSRSVISALNVTSVAEESLSLRGGKPGEYVIEIALADERRGEPIDVSGSLEISVAGTQRTIPFRLSAVSERLGTIKITTVPKLVPLLPNMAWQTR
jgi:tetratricopeptide (TPR) repeat protein